MNKNITVSIGIPAYNEEKNIGALLLSIFEQKATNYTVKEILVYADGCTDMTLQAVQKFSDKTLKIIKGKKRLGKTKRMNQIMKKASGDIVIFLDADVVLVTDMTLEFLTKPFTKNAKIALVGGTPVPFIGGSFTEKAVAATSRAYDELRDKVKGGHNVLGCCGSLLAISKKLAKKIQIPDDVFANDAYLYFACITGGFTFHHVNEAKVWFRVPTNMQEQILQNKRFASSPYHLKKYFGELVVQEYQIPKLLFYSILFKHFVKTPVHSFYIFFVNGYSKISAKRTVSPASAAWQIALSTKEGF